MLGLDDATFGVVAVGLFMQICGFLQMPQLLGPTFSPFNSLISLVGQWMQKIPKAKVDRVPEGAPKPQTVSTGGVVVNGSSTVTQQKKKRRSRNKKKVL